MVTYGKVPIVHVGTTVGTGTKTRFSFVDPLAAVVLHPTKEHSSNGAVAIKNGLSKASQARPKIAISGTA